MKQFDFKKWRVKHGMTQVQAAAVIGISERQMKYLEAGVVTKHTVRYARDCQDYDKKIKSK